MPFSEAGYRRLIGAMIFLAIFALFMSMLTAHCAHGQWLEADSVRIGASMPQSDPAIRTSRDAARLLLPLAIAGGEKLPRSFEATYAAGIDKLRQVASGNLVRILEREWEGLASAPIPNAYLRREQEAWLAVRAAVYTALELDGELSGRAFEQAIEWLNGSVQRWEVLQLIHEDPEPQTPQLRFTLQRGHSG